MLKNNFVRDIARNDMNATIRIDPADIDEIATIDDRKAAGKNVIMQIRRGQDNIKGIELTFLDGSTKHFPQKACDLVSAKYDSLTTLVRRKFQEEMNKSLPALMKAMVM